MCSEKPWVGWSKC